MRTIRLRGVLRTRVLCFLAVVTIGVFAGANAAFADVTGTGGGAYIASASLTGNLGFASVNVNTGQLESVSAPAPPIAVSPTTNPATLAALDITALGTAGVTATAGSDSSSTSGATGSANLGPTGTVMSSSQVVGASAATPLLGGVAFSADTVSSTCTATDATLIGSTTIVNGLAATGLGGLLVAVSSTPAPNTILSVSFTLISGATVNLTITLNEQTTSSVFQSNSITVNAVHIVETVTTPAIGIIPASTQTLDVILGHSACTVTGPDVNPNLVATFRSFNARLAKHGVQLNWQTASQIDVAGYNVYRQVHGRKVRINKHLIPARNSGRYSFLDRSRKASASYWLQTVNLDGSRSWHGPARVAAKRLAV